MIAALTHTGADAAVRATEAYPALAYSIFPTNAVGAAILGTALLAAVRTGPHLAGERGFGHTSSAHCVADTDAIFVAGPTAIALLRTVLLAAVCATVAFITLALPSGCALAVVAALVGTGNDVASRAGEARLASAGTIGLAGTLGGAVLGAC